MRFPALAPRRLAVLAAIAACAAALIPVAATAATASPAASASAARTSASIPEISISSATLVANGAAVRVAFTATCGAGDSGGVTSTITQAAGDRVAQGTNQGTTQFIGLNCTGKPQPISYLLAANVSGAPFHAGVAVVQANLSDCPGANCASAAMDKVLSIHR